MVSEHLNTEIPWDSPWVGIIKKWTMIRLDTSILVLFLNDIIINQGSNLIVSNNTTSLLARNILIHRTGKLISEPGYLKIWENYIGPLLSISERANLVCHLPWKQ